MEREGEKKWVCVRIHGEYGNKKKMQVGKRERMGRKLEMMGIEMWVRFYFYRKNRKP